MQARFTQDGGSVDYTPGAYVSAGDVVVRGELVGIAKLDIPANALGALAVVGVFDLPKATGVGTAVTAGALVYWNDTTSLATTVAAGSKLLGKSVADASDDDELVRVRLSQ